MDSYTFNAPNFINRIDLIRDVERWYRAGIRAGTACTKTRAEVRGSNAKGRPQKYTGRARMGCKRAPHYRKGGVSHGPKPRSFEYPLNQKIKNSAMRVALTARLHHDKLIIASDNSFSKDDACLDDLVKVNQLEKEKRILFIDTTKKPSYLQNTSGSLQDRFQFINAKFDFHKELVKKKQPGRNIPFRLRQLNAYHILHATKVIISENAIRYLEEYLATGK